MNRSISKSLKLCYSIMHLHELHSLIKIDNVKVKNYCVICNRSFWGYRLWFLFCYFAAFLKNKKALIKEHCL
jgi:hypothetical protein